MKIKKTDSPEKLFFFFKKFKIILHNFKKRVKLLFYFLHY